ncbi:Hypothetical predicted protein [Pelobates cultripes]|uniref:Uncharacterized protein n=1 Tax=Pelobates cultripes TaxID=61616 RepID=A0AAD1RAW7_PELCU|nr:Hypothetical predicted protein [Pelobates cultripes]
MSEHQDAAISAELRDWLFATIAESIPKALAAYHIMRFIPLHTNPLTQRIPTFQTKKVPHAKDPGKGIALLRAKAKLLQKFSNIPNHSLCRIRQNLLRALPPDKLVIS